MGWAERVTGKQGPAKLQPFELVLRINLIGTYNVLRLAAAAINANEPDPGGERGAVVMTASIAAFDIWMRLEQDEGIRIAAPGAF